MRSPISPPWCLWDSATPSARALCATLHQPRQRPQFQPHLLPRIRRVHWPHKTDTSLSSQQHMSQPPHIKRALDSNIITAISSDTFSSLTALQSLDHMSLFPMCCPIQLVYRFQQHHLSRHSHILQSPQSQASLGSYARFKLSFSHYC